MKPRHLACLAAMTVALATGRASAQTPNLPPPGPPPAAAPSPPPRASAGAVRVHLRTLKNKGTAHLYSRRTDGTFGLLCNSPCTADVPVNDELRITLGNDEEEPHTFTVSGDLGSEIDLEVKPASVGPLIGGIILMGSGGAFALSGLLFLALADVTENSSSSAFRNNTADAYQTIGYVFIGLGVGMAAGGLVWLLTRSHEPRVTDRPHDPNRPQVYGRNETLLGDVAALKPRTAAPLPAFTPLTYGFSF